MNEVVPVATVRFERGDAWVLWCVLRQGCDLEDLIRSYTFVARTGVPPYGELAGRLSRAVRAGLMPAPEDGRYRLTPDWYDRIHRLDEEYQAPEYGLLEFEDEEFLAREWPGADGVDFTLPPAEYQQAADRVRLYYERLFRR